jgi:hypothetical protein
VAETNGLLNRRRGSTSTESSNLSPSAFFSSSPPPHVRQTMAPADPEEVRRSLRLELVELMRAQGLEVKGARGIEGFVGSPVIPNAEFGSLRPHIPDVMGYDPVHRRLVFGVVRIGRGELDSEDALEEYNVFLDFNAGAGEHSARLYVMMPEDLLTEFTGMITHYIHREYWHRIVPVGGVGDPRGTAKE